MPPIPLHIDEPITPQKAQGITPQTAQSSPAVLPPTTTTQHSPSSYAPAQPGAAAFPAPTPYTPRAQPQPTRTTQAQQNGPPPPQPGAVPTPSYQQPPTTSPSNSLPPPPKAGEAAQPPLSSQTTHFTAALNQMHIPPPQQNYAPTHSTSTTTTPSRYGNGNGNGPTTLPLGPVSSPFASAGDGTAGPPGYQQNIYAQEMTPAQRASLDQEVRRESIVNTLGLGGVFGDGVGAGAPRGSISLGGEGAGEVAGNAWNAAKGWFNQAGKTLAETEEQVWKRINGER